MKLYGSNNKSKHNSGRSAGNTERSRYASADYASSGRMRGNTEYQRRGGEEQRRRAAQLSGDGEYMSRQAPQSHSSDRRDAYGDVRRASSKTAPHPGRGKRRRKGKKGKKALIIILCVLLALAAAVFIWWKLSVKPPETVQQPKPAANDEEEITPIRGDTKYTFIVLGCDDGNGNTDTIMAVTFDTENHTLNVVNIPRDTLVNVPWSIKKANTLYSFSEDEENAKKNSAMMKRFGDILGYEPDFYVIVDLEAFVELVDAIGGVEYDVPLDMDYDGASVSIHIPAGKQLLTGEQAVGVVRFRSGYANADIGRIGTQQDFLKTAAAQILAKKSSIKISDFVNIFLNYVDTDLTYGNLVWLGTEFMKLDSESITFHTLPGNYGDYVYHGGANVSYVTINIDEWLDMINTYLNPFDTPIKEENLNILTRDANGSLYATSGVREGDESWGSGGSSYSSGSSHSSYSDSSDSSYDSSYSDYDYDDYDYSSSSGSGDGESSGSSSSSGSESSGGDSGSGSSGGSETGGDEAESGGNTGGGSEGGESSGGGEDPGALTVEDELAA